MASFHTPTRIFLPGMSSLLRPPTWSQGPGPHVISSLKPALLSSTPPPRQLVSATHASRCFAVTVVDSDCPLPHQTELLWGWGLARCSPPPALEQSSTLRSTQYPFAEWYTTMSTQPNASNLPVTPQAMTITMHENNF